MNSRRYTMTSLSIVFLAITMVTVSGLGQNAYAAGMSLSVDADYASGSISVSGDTDRSGDVSILVTAENGNISAVDQVTPSGGSFMTTIETGGALWTQDGMYTISAYQGDASSYQKSAQIEIVDGHVIPEFGVIAGVILAVAIASIIAVSAKSRLTLVPKY